MLNYEYIFATELYKKLKPRIKGEIYVCITKYNELSVKINNLNLEYEYLSENKFSDMVLNGYSTDDAMWEVMQDYQQFVYEKLFW